MVFRVFTFKDDDGVWHLKNITDEVVDTVHDSIAALIDMGEF